MLTWAVAYTIVHADVVGSMLFAGIIGDAVLTLLVVSLASPCAKALQERSE